jgi:hypothetical protein
MNNTAFVKEQFDSLYPPGIENHYWNLSRNRIIFDTLKNHALLNKKILEIGCGRGIVVDYLLDQDIDIIGCDLAPVPVDEKLKSVVFPGIDASQLPDNIKNRTEVILLLDIIEHIELPVDFLNTIITVFTNTQYYLITVPACQELWSNYDEYNGHYTRYDLKMIKSLTHKTGLHIVRLHYLYHSLYLPAWLILKLFSKRKTHLKEPRGLGKLIHKIIANFFYFDNKLLPGKIKGTTLLIILEKK